MEETLDGREEMGESVFSLGTDGGKNQVPRLGRYFRKIGFFVSLAGLRIG